MRFSNFLIAASALLSIVSALPVARQEDRSLSNHKFNIDSIRSLTPREFNGQLERDDLDSELLERARSKGSNSKRKGSSSKRKGSNSRKPQPSKITFGDKAKKDLDDLGLHGKERRKAKQYHRKIIKDHMKTVPGAHTADIARIAHLGGTTPNDPLHATVVYRGKPKTVEPWQKLSSNQRKKLVIKTTYKDHDGITRAAGMHHVYPKQAQHPLPPSYAAAERVRFGLAPTDPIPHKH